MNTDTSSHALPSGFILNNQYIIDSVRGEGGFGITYAGHIKDSMPLKRIAIKEYYPSGVAGRSHRTTPYEVTHFGGTYAVSFNKGLHRFFNEAVLLKKFSNLESIVTILNVFEENNTAYIIMDYIEGISLKQLIDSEGVLSFDEIYELMLPIMNDLSVIHEEGLIHRDISPDNLLVGTDNKLHLIDFGSANYINPNETKTITVMLKAGYAPPEQYLTNGHIGPWTDVYGLCATIYYVITGQTPPDAVTRMQRKEEALLIYPDNDTIPEFRFNALIRGLNLSYSERFATIKALCQALTTPDMKEEKNTVMMISSSRRYMYKFLQNIKKHITSIVIGIIAGSIIIFLITYNSSIVIPENNVKEIKATPSITDNVDAVLKMTGLTGQTLENAVRMITKLDSSIKINTIYEYNSTYNFGIIIDQNIASGYLFHRGELDSIILKVSKGAEPEQSPASTEQIKTTPVPSPATSPSHSPKKSSQSEESTDNISPKSNSGKHNVNKPKSNSDGYTIIHLD